MIIINHNTSIHAHVPCLFVCRWLRENKHLRYMWIPYTDTVVVVQCNPEASTQVRV